MGHLRSFIFLATVGILSGAVFRTEEDKDNEVDAEVQTEESYEEKWFEVYLNPFDIFDNTTFFLRYFEEDKFFKPGGPLIVELGGEWAISADSLTTFQSYALAEDTKGKLIYLEHRYYGKSSPYENLTTATLTYLSVEHVLEDFANVVVSLKKATPGMENSKVAVFGCSYSAALATWFRYKFPHLVDAAWASSGPLLAAIDFYQYLEVAASVYYNTSSECYNTIKDGYRETKELLETPEGEEKVKNELQNWGCGNITEMTPDEILGNIRFVLADHNVPADHGLQSCNILRKEEKNFTAYDKLRQFMMEKSASVCEQSEDVEFPNDGVAWEYQTCTEFGFTITTSSKKQPFNDSADQVADFVNSCMIDFGDELTLETIQRGIDRTNRNYGATDAKVTNVVSVHGTLDPWYKLGLHKQTSPEAPVILIEGTSHCADQAAEDYNDLPQLKRARRTARKLMKKWLGSTAPHHLHSAIRRKLK